MKLSGETCKDTRKCCFKHYYGAEPVCGALRETYDTDGACPFRKKRMTDINHMSKQNRKRAVNRWR